MKYQKTDKGFFSQASSVINGLRKCVDVSEKSASIRTKSSVLLLAAVMSAFVVFAIFAPRPAHARAAILNNYVANYPGTKLANLCGNCHVDWAGGGIGSAERIDVVLYGVPNMTPPFGSQFYLNDPDMDGVSTGAELANSQSASRPALPAKWFPGFPDKDGDGCQQLLNNLGESGTYQAPINLDSSAFVGASSGFIGYAPQGWDVDDNDATQGCSTPWPTTPSSGPFNNPGVTTDAIPPAAITDLRAIINANSGVIPLVWTAVGDDGMAGNAHDYDIRYMANPAMIVAGRNPRLAADWATMYRIAEDQMGNPPSTTWNKGTGLTPLMRAMYEPIPSAPGATQACNALGYSPLCTANAGASYVLGNKGSDFMTNVIANGATYWVAMRTSDGVVKPSGTLTAPGTITENASLSNIIAVTAGPAGTAPTSGMAISTISPTTLTGPNSSTLTVTGFGLNLNANQVVNMYLTNSAGTAVAAATGLSCNGTSCTGVFTFPIANGVYNLELRNGTGLANTKAARVNAVTVTSVGNPPPPTVTSATPNSRGQGATNQNVTITGTDFTGATSVSFGAGVTVNTFIVNSSTQITANITVAATATLGPRSVTVTNAAGTNAANTLFSVVVAPTLTCSPPNGTYGVAYSYVCIASGGTPPYTWTAIGLPPGLNASVSADTTTLMIAGTPNAVGTYVGSVSVTDFNAGRTSVVTSITIPLVTSDVDLVMTAVSTSTTSVATATYFVIDSTEANIGTTDMTAANNIVSFYLSTDNIITTSDIELVASRSVPALAAGASSTGSTSTFARASTPSGTYYLGACADVSNAQPETNETNNCRAGGTITIASTTVPGAPTIGAATAGNASASVIFTAPVNDGGSAITSYTATSNPGGITGTCTASPCTVSGLTNGTAYTFTVTATNAVGTGPASAASNSVTPGTISNVDLVMTAVSTSVTSVGTGAMFVIDSTEANIGTTDMTAANNIVSFYLSTDNIITTSDIELVASRSVPALAAGASSAGSTSTFARASTPLGTYYLGACADVSNAQPETNETNNCRAGGTITIVNIITVPGAPTIGTATAGNASASVTFTAPVSNGGSAITSYTATSSPGGITGTCTASPCIVSGLTNGTAYTFTVTATNAAGTGPASAASNSVTPGTISNVDLVVTAVSTTTSSVATATYFVIDSTEANIGTTDMTAANNIVSFYLSTDNIITTSDIELVASRSVPALAAGASSAGSTSTFARASTPSGTYYLGACADVTNLQLETNEANNCLASAATITIIGSITVPGAPTMGTATAGNASASVTFTAPVNNGGSAITSYTATSSPGGITGTCTASPCTVSGLTNGTAYTFTVTATNAAGTGPASAASNSVTPQENVPPSVPTRLTATAFSTTQINLSWRASTDNVGVTGYKVYRNGVQVGAPSGTSYSDTGLTVATSYQYTVAACDAAGNCSAQSAVVTGTTKKK